MPRKPGLPDGDSSLKRSDVPINRHLLPNRISVIVTTDLRILWVGLRFDQGQFE